ncbi:MAG TPA: DUF2911 domain-containing protein [Cyclobacteriaceae bacterium]|nr:DUF2911 domain-containing protein [Cyclobacteriaceae bacterium]
MKNYIVLFCLLAVCVLMSCSEKKSIEEKASEQTAPPAAEVLDEGVVIGKQLQEDTLKGSLKAYAKGRIGEAEFKITYHSPAVRGRIVWGGLVPFDKVWVTGAHMATTIESNTDFILGKTVINAGKYGLFTIPGKDKWTVIINKNWQQHLTDEYDSKDDVARLEIISSQLPENQERLQYEVVAKSEYECAINVSWDRVQLQIPITIINPNID